MLSSRISRWLNANPFQYAPHLMGSPRGPLLRRFSVSPWACAVAFATVGCGRIGYDPIQTASRDGGPFDGQVLADAADSSLDAGNSVVPSTSVQFISSGNLVTIRDLDVSPVNGQLIGVGDFWDDVTVDGTFIAGHVPSPFVSDGLVVAYESDGAFAWRSVFIGESVTELRGTKVAPNGDVLITGNFLNRTPFGPFMPDAGSRQDAMLVTTDSLGDVTDLVVYPSVGANAQGRDLDFDDGPDPDSDPDFYVIAGLVGFTIDLGAGPYMRTGVGDDGFLSAWAQPDQAPTFVAGQTMGGSGVSRGVALGTNHICVVGSHAVNVDIGQGPVPSNGGSDGFVAIYERDGTPLAAETIGGGVTDRTEAVVADSGCVVTGFVEGDANFGEGPVTGLGGTDMFVVAYATNGDLRWVRVFGGSGADAGTDLTRADDGTLVVGGTFSGSVVIDGTPLSSQGLRDILFVGLDPLDGAVRWIRTTGGAGDETRAIVTTEGTQVAAAVNFTGSTEVGGMPFTATAGSVLFRFVP